MTWVIPPLGQGPFVLVEAQTNPGTGAQLQRLLNSGSAGCAFATALVDGSILYFLQQGMQMSGMNNPGTASPMQW